MKKIFLLILLLSTLSDSFSQNNIEITTVLKDKYFDKQGNPLTGKGVVVGDVDSGIDIFHPMFFFADGSDFYLFDVDDDKKFTPGIDGIDINLNGKLDKPEVLNYLEIRDNTWDMLAGQDKKKFNPSYDFLYLDENGNSKRDYGTQSGFKESDPTYGEQFFIAIDDNKNGLLDISEKIIGLKTSKVRAVREKNGTIRRRGIDLILTEPDSSGHGTGVAGLILGGHYGVQKIHGIAPDAEIVIASIKYDYTPRFVRNFPDLIKFLKDENINILLFEDGEWMWEFMDGSSEEEEMVNQMARDGITIIGGAGNFATSKMMLSDKLVPNEPITYKFDCPQLVEGKINDGVFVTILWKTDATLNCKIETPDKKISSTFSNGSDFIHVGNYNISYVNETSHKGTHMIRLGFSHKDSASVKGSWKITISSDKETEFRAYVVDVSQSWNGSSRWNSNKTTDASSVTFPSTADSCMAIGAYVVNFGFFDKTGDLATYSSRGYNITGKLGVDLTAPGHTTLTTETNNAYGTFSGTSSAAPHVVGAAALLLQYDPSLTHSQIKQILRNTAKSDNFTGPVPNEKWGYGKLDIEAAIKYLINNYK